ncbi:Pimeloyl-ACP methyl ester carboxylesterase [Paenimyroides aquimaris]|uniref:Pimeloyl-ACP methyl ester carboxylesterase n=1 Tax=Paenimyroides marinum TaxID=1159016 RepID=A0A1H6MBR3_9FLAO|nr:alpha/beta fold hydrolase [Paenimyroides aquimaris]SEH98836.1 Pimeloyl-ACP methyl ester carboxylesterase [Paenimyroides aquimaris]
MIDNKKLPYSKIEGSGKPLLILHGFLGMSDNWKTLGAKYADSGFAAHLMDLRNHGRSFHSDVFNYDVMANDVVAYCKANNLNKIDIIGHSMGGKVAMNLAVHYPELINKLIVADMSPKYYAPHHQDVMAALNAVDFSGNPSRNDVQYVIEQHVKEPGVVQFLMKNVYRVTPQQLGFRFNLDVFNSNDQAIGEALKEDDVFNGPTLFLKGSNSNYIQEEDAFLIKKHFPNAVIETISNSGHWVHADNPGEFFEKSMAFLK